MKASSALVCLVLAVLLACSHRATNTGALPSPRGDTSSNALALLGLRELSETRLPPGMRELRVWPSAGPTAEHLLYRLRDDGRQAALEAFLFWPVTPDRPWRAMVASLPRGVHCATLRHNQQTVACRVWRARGTAARGVVARVDSFGGWTPVQPVWPAPAAGVHVQLDGWGARVETRRGAAYEQITCWQRDLTPGSLCSAMYSLIAQQ